MDKFVAENQPLVAVAATALIAVLVHFHFSDAIIVRVLVALVFGGGVLLAMSEDVIDKRIGYAVCAANLFIVVTSFFASESEFTDPGWGLTVKGATWTIFLANLWAIGRLIDSKNQKAGRLLRVAAGALFVIGVVASYLRQTS